MSGKSNVRVYVGTHALVARAPDQAKREYDSPTQHVCDEDGNPYHVMLDWERSTEHVVCPDCQSPSHRTKGHWCPPKQKTVVVPFPKGKADGRRDRLLGDAIDTVAEAVRWYSDEAINDNPKGRRSLAAAWDRVRDAAKGKG